MAINLLEFADVSFAYGTHTAVLDHLSFALREGERLAIIGASGGGKSTLLSLAAGLIRPTSGRVTYAGVDVLGPSRQRVILFQEHGLFPWASAEANVAFALKARGGAGADEARAQLARFGMEAFAARYPAELSGGQRQRVSLARALAGAPELLLLDEPFAALDVLTRGHLLDELRTKLPRQFILVTHAIDEALFLCDRVLVLGGVPTRVFGEVSWTTAKALKFTAMKRQPEFTYMESCLYQLLEGGLAHEDQMLDHSF